MSWRIGLCLFRIASLNSFGGLRQQHTEEMVCVFRFQVPRLDELADRAVFIQDRIFELLCFDAPVGVGIHALSDSTMPFFSFDFVLAFFSYTLLPVRFQYVHDMLHKLR